MNSPIVIQGESNYGMTDFSASDYGVSIYDVPDPATYYDDVATNYDDPDSNYGDSSYDD